MRPVSEAYLRTVRGSHTAAFRARVVTGLTTGTDPDGTEITILGGDVQLDANADVYSTLDMSTDGTGMWPRRASDLLAPFGNEVFVERGVVVAGGSTEWVSLGYHRIQAPEQDDAPDGPIRISGRDRMAGIIDARLVAPIQFTAATTVGSIVDQLVLEVYPTATIEWDDSTDLELLGRSLVAEEDRHGFLDELITAHGKRWRWDHRGILIIFTPPSSTVPVFDVTHGRNGVLIEMGRQLTREGIYNGVVATGEAADTEDPVRGLAVDDNPSSPTYWHGENTSGRTFGKVPRFFASEFLTTAAQCDSAAAAMLRRQLGAPYSVDFSAVPNGALEPLDPVKVTYSDRGQSEVHVLERLTVPLEAESALTATTREQTLIVIGQVA
jgi:hypothetical protein